MIYIIPCLLEFWNHFFINSKGQRLEARFCYLKKSEKTVHSLPTTESHDLNFKNPFIIFEQAHQHHQRNRFSHPSQQAVQNQGGAKILNLQGQVYFYAFFNLKVIKKQYFFRFKYISTLVHYTK